MEELEGLYEQEKKTILIVDDEESIMDLLVFNLEKEGYNTLKAYDGITAVWMEFQFVKKLGII